MRRNRVVALVVAFAIAVAGCGSSSSSTTSKTTSAPTTVVPETAATNAANHFFATYLDASGRVIRHDQGNDTVSEGQAYGMLIAVATGDRAKFDSIWNWSKANLLQTNGLLAWRWENGKVVDTQGATDADMDAAHALGLASTKFNNPAYGNDAKSLAKAIAQLEVFYDYSGAPVLMAGPWATVAPYYVNPSYASPRAEQDLATLTSDARWPQIEARERTLVDSVIDSAANTMLPPDWAILNPANGGATASGAPNTKDEPAYSYDALRVPIRLAASCNADDTSQAGRLWPILKKNPTSATWTLDGTVKDASASAPAAIASAAAAQADGDQSDANKLYTKADQLEAAHTTYYGAAWAALGRIMLTTPWLGSC